MAQLTENAIKLLKEKKYFRDNENTWDDLCNRVITLLRLFPHIRYSFVTDE